MSDLHLKGHAKIELTNTNTGETQVIEEDNFITNLIKDSVQNNMYGPDLMKYIRSKWPNPTDLINNLFGGILIFDKSMGEDPSKYHIHPGVTTVGQGYNQAYTGKGTTFGSYNESESIVPNKLVAGQTFKKVWDFSTSQANGTIASICLCPTITGILGMGTASANKSLNVPDVYNDIYYPESDKYAASIEKIIPGSDQSFNKRVYGFDYDNYKVYQLTNTANLFNADKRGISINTYDINPYKYDIFKVAGSSRDMPSYLEKTVDVAIPDDIKEIISTRSKLYASISVDPKHFKAYITFSYEHALIYPSDKIVTMIVDMKEGTATSEIIENPFKDSTSLYIGITGYASYDDGNKIVNIDDNKPLLIHINNYIIAMVLDSDKSNVKTEGYFSNGDVKADGETGIYIINCRTGNATIIKDANQNDIKYNVAGAMFQRDEVLRLAEDERYVDIDWDNNLVLLNYGHIFYYNLGMRLDTWGGDESTLTCSGLAVLDVANATVRHINDCNQANTMDNNSRHAYYFSLTDGYSYYSKLLVHFPQNYIWSPNYYNNWTRYDRSRLDPYVLSTINNLENPIEKTDEQMMKITYELTITE